MASKKEELEEQYRASEEAAKKILEDYKVRVEQRKQQDLADLEKERQETLKKHPNDKQWADWAQNFYDEKRQKTEKFYQNDIEGQTEFIETFIEIGRKGLEEQKKKIDLEEELEEKNKEVERLKGLLSKTLYTEVKPSIIAKPKELTPEEQAENIDAMINNYTSDVIRLELRNLAATLVGTYGDLDLGEKIINTCDEIREKVSPKKTFREHDTLEYGDKVIALLNEVKSKQKFYAEKVRTEISIP